MVDELIERDERVLAMVRSSPVKHLKYIPKSSKWKIISGDVLDYGSLQKALFGVDKVYHLAAVSGIDESRQMIEQCWEANTRGTLNVVRASLEAGVRRILYVSTCHIYGQQKTLPIEEGALANPNDIYAASKYSGELICKTLSNMNPELDIVYTRAFNHFGPRQRPEWLISNIIRQALHCEKIELSGAGTPTRDFSYVTDIMRGYAYAMDEGRRGEVYQFCSGKERSVESVVRDTLALIEVQKEVKFAPPRPADMNRQYGSYEKARRELGWSPKVSWLDALKETIEWYRNNE